MIAAGPLQLEEQVEVRASADAQRLARACRLLHAFALVALRVPLLL
jgi:hypothetical protein